MTKPTTQQKLEGARAKLGELRDLLDQNGALLAEDDLTESARTRLQKQASRLEEKVATHIRKVQELGLALKRESHAALAAEIEEDEIALASASLSGGNKKALQALIARAHEVLNLRKTRLIVTAQEKTAEAFLRRLVEEGPQGWTFHDDSNKRYRYVRLGRLTIVLQDTPRYSIAFGDLVAWIGFEAASKFAKVDSVALVKAIENDEIVDLGGAKVLPGDWFDRRTRTVGTPKVVINENDPLGRARVLNLRSEFLGMTLEELQEATSLNGSEINPFLSQGITLVAQLRGFSGEQLQAIKGIGPVRAKRLLDEVSRLGQMDESAETEE